MPTACVYPIDSHQGQYGHSSFMFAARCVALLLVRCRAGMCWGCPHNAGCVVGVHVVVLQVRSFIDDAYKRTVAVLREKKDLVESMAQVGCCAVTCCAVLTSALVFVAAVGVPQEACLRTRVTAAGSDP
jgi:hypothetical protein